MDVRYNIVEGCDDKIDNYIIDDVRLHYINALPSLSLSAAAQDLKKILVDSLPPGTHLTVSNIVLLKSCLRNADPATQKFRFFSTVAIRRPLWVSVCG